GNSAVSYRAVCTDVGGAAQCSYPVDQSTDCGLAGQICDPETAACVDCLDDLDCGFPFEVCQDKACTAFCTDDDSEDNDDAGHPAALAGDSLLEGRVYCDGDEDYYAFPAVAGDSISVLVDFVHADGNLDLELIGPDGSTVVASSTSATDGEAIEDLLVGSGEAGTYTARVYAAAGVQNGYDLLIALSDDPCFPNPCTTPPPASCAGEVLTRYANPGACTDNAGQAECDYQEEVIDCAASGLLCDEIGAACVECFEDTDCAWPFEVCDASACTAGCQDDAYEDNDIVDDATAVSDGTDWSDLVLCSTDSDYYAVDLTANEEISVAIRFSHADGDLDMLLLDPSGVNAVATSNSSTDDEAIDHTAVETGLHYIAVFGATAGDQNVYGLTVSVFDDPCLPNPCTSAPADACVGNLLASYLSPGTCTDNAGTPECDYPIDPNSVDCGATGAVCQAAACAGRFAVAGDVIISEYLANPAYVNDEAGEWLEIHNCSTDLVNLRGLVFSDASDNTFTVQDDIMLAPGDEAVLAVDADPGTNGGVAADYDYPDTFSLDEADEVISIERVGQLVDEICWAVSREGASAQLAPAYLDADSNDFAEHWCQSTAAWGAGTDLGSPGGDNAACPPPSVPFPAIIGYGAFHRGFDPTILDRAGEMPVPNVADVWAKEDYQKEAVRSLTDRGVLCAKHRSEFPIEGDSRLQEWEDLKCLNNADPPSDQELETCIEINVDTWEDAYSDELGGLLPDGFQAITVDEFLGSWRDTSLQYRIGFETLKRVKERNPDRLIFVWGVYGKEDYDDPWIPSALAQLYTYADLYMEEVYVDELSTPADRDSLIESRILKIRDTCQGHGCDGLLEKTVIGLSTADTEDYAYDRDPGVDFPDFVDSEIHFIRNTSVLDQLPGVAFYSFARTRPETVAWINKLARHYYIDQNTSLYGDGDDSLPFVSDPSFESGTGWSFQAGAGGEIAIKHVEPDLGWPSTWQDPVTGKHRVPHGDTVLYMRKGTDHNRVTQNCTVSPREFYHLDVYAKSQTEPTVIELAADVEVLDTSENDLITFKEKAWIRSDSGRDVDYYAEYHRWTRFRIEFKTPRDVSEIQIVLSDAGTSPNDVTLWDFAELEKLKVGSLTAGIGGVEVDERIVKNRDFEQDSYFWWEWRAYGNTLYGQIVSTPAQSGTRSLLAQSDTGTDAWLQDVFLQNPKKYKVSGWVYWVQAGAGAQASIQVRAYDTDGGYTDFRADADSALLGDWQYVETEFQLGWQYENRALLFVRTDGACQAYFDTLEIEEVPL
ncbi:MAG: lamin tail domain-containing protein, partial [Deltaproteobacteria bacterium]|nr:lamin tail domain-containing protein [Deltaproteobacteria bacterium]